MTSLNPSLRLALLQKAKGKKNILQKGFTLVELMVVIVIVGVLSATAIPQFLGLKDRAEAGAAIASMAGFAKECATGQITNTAAQMTNTKLTNARITTTFDETSSAGLACDGADTAGVPVTFSNTDAFDAKKIKGVLCGKDVLGANQAADGDKNTTCTLSVDKAGTITGVWSPTT